MTPARLDPGFALRHAVQLVGAALALDRRRVRSGVVLLADQADELGAEVLRQAGAPGPVVGLDRRAFLRLPSPALEQAAAALAALPEGDHVLLVVRRGTVTMHRHPAKGAN